MKKLKEFDAFILLPIGILTGVAFLMSLIGVILYGANCASEFNGNNVSERAVGFALAATIIGGLTLGAYIASLFLSNNRKTAYLFAFSRIGNYASFVLLLAGFLFEILDEYSLLGTILYPIVSGTVGDPVDSLLSFSFFASLILLLLSLILHLVLGILMRRKSHRIYAGSEEKEASYEK